MRKYSRRYSTPSSRGIVEQNIGNIKVRVILCPNCNREFTHIDTGSFVGRMIRIKNSGENCPIINCPVCGKEMALIPHLREGALVSDDRFTV